MRMYLSLLLVLFVPLPSVFADEKVEELVQRLGADEFAQRQEAFDALRSMGYRILPELKKCKEKTDDVQVLHLLEKLILLLSEQEREAKLVEEVVSVGFSRDEALKIAELLLSHIPQFRLRGLQKLAERNGRKALPIFFRFVKDRDRHISLFAAGALAEHSERGNREVLFSILAVMKNVGAGSDVGRMYLKSFLTLYDATDVEVTRRILELPLTWREVIISELVLNPTEEYLVAFASFLGDEDVLIRKLARGGIQLLLEKRSEDDYFLDVPTGTVEPLLEVLKKSIGKGGGEAASAVSILARLKTEGVTPLLLDVLEEQSGLAAESAIEGLGMRGAKEAVKPILDAMGRDATLIKAGCEALIRIGDASVVATLKKMLLEPKTVFYREILDALGVLAPDELFDAALRILAEGEPTSKRDAQLALIKTFCRKKLSGKMLERLLDVLKNGEVLARLMVADVVAQAGGVAVSGALKRLFKEGDAYTRAAVVKAIALLENDPAFAKENLSDSSALVRWRAAEALALLGDIRPLLKLKELKFDLSLDDLTGEVSKVDPLRIHSRALFRLFGLNIYIDPKTSGGKKVVLKEGETLLDAVEKLALENGILVDYSFGVVLFVAPGRRSLYRNWSLKSDGSAPLERTLVSVLVRRDPLARVLDRVCAYLGVEVELAKEVLELSEKDPKMKEVVALWKEGSEIETELVGIRATEALRLILAPFSLKAELRNRTLYITK